MKGGDYDTPHRLRMEIGVRLIEDEGVTSDFLLFLFRRIWHAVPPQVQELLPPIHWHSVESSPWQVRVIEEMPAYEVPILLLLYQDAALLAKDEHFEALDIFSHTIHAIADIRHLIIKDDRKSRYVYFSFIEQRWINEPLEVL